MFSKDCLYFTFYQITYVNSLKAMKKGVPLDQLEEFRIYKI